MGLERSDKRISLKGHKQISEYILMPHTYQTNIQIYLGATYLLKKYPNIFVRWK